MINVAFHLDGKLVIMFKMYQCWCFQNVLNFSGVSIRSASGSACPNLAFRYHSNILPLAAYVHSAVTICAHLYQTKWIACKELVWCCLIKDNKTKTWFYWWKLLHHSTSITLVLFYCESLEVSRNGIYFNSVLNHFLVSMRYMPGICPGMVNIVLWTSFCIYKTNFIFDSDWLEVPHDGTYLILYANHLLAIRGISPELVRILPIFQEIDHFLVFMRNMSKTSPGVVNMVLWTSFYFQNTNFIFDSVRLEVLNDGIHFNLYADLLPALCGKCPELVRVLPIWSSELCSISIH